MINLENISKLEPGQKIVEGFVTVELKAQGTKTGKPIYSVFCYRAEPLCAGQMDAYSPKAALRNAKWYQSNLKKTGRR